VTTASDAQAAAAVRALAIALREDDPHDDLMRLIGDAELVLLGEASHGTHEFYRERARITQRLLTEKGFHAVAIEGDWPHAYRANRFVRGLGPDRSAAQALQGFERFPTWMWRNTEVVQFLQWLRAFNRALPPRERCGIYGLDLYSLHSSMAAVLAHLDAIDPALAALARERYACFDRFGDDSRTYGLMTGLRGADSCEAAVQATLADLRRRAAAADADAAEAADPGDAEAAFDAAQNAHVVATAEAYHRSLFLSDVSCWNLRDLHMAETLERLRTHLQLQGGPGGDAPKIVVWAHNSHIGDARATEMGQRRGELNLGQLVREQHGRRTVLVGFGTHRGSVTAASDWDAPAQCMAVVPSRPDSHEGLMHATGLPRFLLPLRDAHPLPAPLAQPRLERAIGVIYRPGTERMSHYFHADLGAQFDAWVHIDTTRALEPLEPGPGWADAEAPATYPAGV
jgi:erythromycin esterase-like protein